MITSELNLSMATPTIEQAYAKKGDSGRVLKINLIDAEPEDGTLRIRRPDGVEVTSDAESGVSESGDVVTFEAYEEVPLEKLEVDLEPVQDLNGYDAPWVGGGGKNKLDILSLTPTKNENGMTFTVNDDGSVTINGTATSQSQIYWQLEANVAQQYSGMILDCFETMPSGNSVFAVLEESGGSYTRYALDNTTSGATIASSIASTTNKVNLIIRAVQGVSVTNAKVYPMIRTSGSTDGFAPYSNICPIYPSNGKNLYPDSSVSGSSASLNYYNVFHPSVPIELKADVTYTISFDYVVTADISTAITFSVGVGTGSAYYTDIATFYTANYNGKMVATFTPTSAQLATYKYMSLRFPRWGQVVTNVTWSLSNIQLEYGSVATPYVPYQGINLYQQGKNVLPNDLTWTSGLRNDSGTHTSSSVSHYSSPFPVRPSTQYTLQGILYNTTNYRAYYLDANCGWISRSASLGNQVERITTPENCYYMQVQCANELDLSSNAQIEVGSTATSYEPYNGTTYPLSLGRDVYGGTVDVVSGKLVVDKVFNLVDGSSSTGWNRIATYGTSTRFDFSISDIKYDSGANTLTNMFSKITIGTANAIGFSVHASSHLFQIQVPTATADTVADLMTYFSANNLQIVYVLDTPLEYDLTLTQIKTLIGTNNMWSSGVVDVVFSYDSLFATLPSQATEVVGKCIGDVNFTDISTLPFIFTVKENQA